MQDDSRSMNLLDAAIAAIGSKWTTYLSRLDASDLKLLHAAYHIGRDGVLDKGDMTEYARSQLEYWRVGTGSEMAKLAGVRDDRLLESFERAKAYAKAVDDHMRSRRVANPISVDTAAITATGPF